MEPQAGQLPADPKRFAHITEANKLLVLYHDGCHDGFACALIAAGALGDQCVQLVPVRHGGAVPQVVARDVLVCDFAYKREAMISMNRVARSFQVLDHHATARDACKDLDFCTFVEDACGAALTWEYFHPGFVSPWWVRLIEDRDLWRYEFGQETRNFRAWMESFPMTLGGWREALGEDFSDRVRPWHVHGPTLLRLKAQQVEDICKMARAVPWTWDYPNLGSPLTDVPVVVVVTTFLHISDVCHRLLEKFPGANFALSMYRDDAGKWVHSLRSRSGLEPDVSKIAQSFEGGGHPDAAGFTLNRPLWT